MENHIALIGGIVDPINPDLELLVRTHQFKPQDTAELLKKANANLTNQTLTSIVDCATFSKQQNTLSDPLLKLKNVSSLVAYSSWNTPGNAIGLVLGYAPSRVMVLKYATAVIQTKTVEPHATYLYYSFAKDTVYQNKNEDKISSLMNASSMKRDAYQNITAYLPEKSKTYGLIRAKANWMIRKDLIVLQNSFIHHTVIEKWQEGNVRTRQISRIMDNSNWVKTNAENGVIDFPWKRSFEARLSVNVVLK
jgi:hypothetical protein